MPAQVKQIYEFGPFRVDTAERVLLRDGRPVQLTPKAFDVLLMLVERSGHIVEKGELINRVWPDSFVEEGNLKVTVSALRKVLEGDEGLHQFIETVPRRGYRFQASVRELSDDGSKLILLAQSQGQVIQEEQESESISEAQERRPSPTIPAASSNSRFIVLISKHKISLAIALAVLVIAVAAIDHFSRTPRVVESVAVLPFVSVKADPSLEYLSDGITDSLINDLSQFPNLKVIARSSVFRYKDKEIEPRLVARELGVQSVLTGKVTQRGEDMIVSAELVDARDESVIWSNQYNRKLSDFFAVQDEIARSISEKLRLKLNGDDRRQPTRTASIKAYENYIKGEAYLHVRTRKDLLVARRYYEAAINEDENYARAYVGLAQVYGNLGARGYISPVEGRRQMERAAQRALQLDKNLAESHAAVGISLISFAPFSFAEADSELRRAIEIGPGLPMAHLYLSLSLMRQGRFEEGQAEMLKAQELDPLSAIIARQVALYYLLKRDYDRAVEILRQANATGPAFTTNTEIEIYVKKRLFDEALRELKKSEVERSDDPILIYSAGMVYAAQGSRVDALNSVKRLTESQLDSGCALLIARIYAELGEGDKALEWLERGLSTGALAGAFYKDEPVWDQLRSNPRFTPLLRRMGYLDL